MDPRVTFKIDQRKDLASAKTFINEAGFDDGRNLKWALFKKHPSLRKVVTQKDGPDYQALRRYIEKIYQADKRAIASNFKIYQANWRKIENDFFCLTDELFPRTAWPKGRYIAYATIWGMFPRFLDDKTFQIPIKYRSKRYVSVIIAHEMLHFLFYAHLRKDYPQYKDPKHSFFIWHISEIFNALVQDSPSWMEVFRKRTMPYPEHARTIRALRKRYSDPVGLGADGLIRVIVPFAKKLVKA